MSIRLNFPRSSPTVLVIEGESETVSEAVRQLVEANAFPVVPEVTRPEGEADTAEVRFGTALPENVRTFQLIKEAAERILQESGR